MVGAWHGAVKKAPYSFARLPPQINRVSFHVGRTLNQLPFGQELGEALIAADIQGGGAQGEPGRMKGCTCVTQTTICHSNSKTAAMIKGRKSP